MSAAVTHDILVSVRSGFEAAHSDPRGGLFVHGYRITIENRGPVAVKLQRRHWVITDSLAAEEVVDAPGVVGETPVIEPGESYSYHSACHLSSSLGQMRGSYSMERADNGQTLVVEIPAFVLQYPPTLN